MKPLAHARLCAVRRGGTWQDTITLQTWLDSSKASFASVQHRALLHHDLGATVARRLFGDIRVGQTTVSAFDLVADHVTEDLGSLVPLSRWLDTLDDRAMTTQRVDRHRRSVLVLRNDTAAAAAVRWGGTPAAYTPIVEILDLPTALSGGHPRARALFHNSFGPFIVEQLLGPAIALDGHRLIPTRTVAEDIILARVGWIPPCSFVLGRIPMQAWMTGAESTPAIAARKLDDARSQAVSA